MKYLFIIFVSIANNINACAQVYKMFNLGTKTLNVYTSGGTTVIDTRSISADVLKKDTLLHSTNIIHSKWHLTDSNDIKFVLLKYSDLDNPPLRPVALTRKLVMQGNKYKVVGYDLESSPLDYCMYDFYDALQGRYEPNPIDSLPRVFVPSDGKLTFAFDITEDTSGFYLSILSNTILTTWKYTPDQRYEVPDSTGTSAILTIHWKLEHKLTGLPLQDFVVHKVNSDFIYCMYSGEVFKVNNQQKTVLGQLNIQEKAYMQVGTNSVKIMPVTNNVVGNIITHSW